VVLDVLASYGLRGDDALHAVRGTAQRHPRLRHARDAGGFGIPLVVGESFERPLRIFVDGLRRQRPASKK
jgi:hypothetical protein